MQLARLFNMGSSFFKVPKVGPSNMNLEARSIGASAGQARGSAIGAQKDLGAALALNKYKFKPQKTNGAYAPGPKV
jgi:hypothetical protein